MSSTKTTAVEQQFHNHVKSFESDFAKFAGDVAKLAKTLKDARNSKATWPMMSLTQIDRAVKAYCQYSEKPSATGFANSLRAIEADYRALFQSEFGKDLLEQATVAKLAFKPHDDFYTVGPVDVIPHLNKESVSLRYAKTLVLDDVPLDPKEIIAAIIGVAKELLDRKYDVRKLAADFEVAARVCIARNGLVKHGTLRAELPQLLQEMEVIRARSKGDGKLAYGRSRFVTELATLVKSNENIEGKLGKEFRLETAVIDNSRNDAKSVFVPDRLHNGSGEGKYYQAMNIIYGG